MNNYCAYFHINPIKLNVFYVGIGNIKRPYSKRFRNNAHDKVVNKYGHSV